MKCERGMEKSVITNCQGKFCEPDGFNAVRIAQNFPTAELVKRLEKAREQLLEKPESCNRQAAFNQLKQALNVKGVFN